MRYKKNLIAVLLMTAVIIIIPAACQSPAAPASGTQFEVTSLQVKPAEVNSGDSVKVIADITNSGGTSGNYTAKLIVDGIKTEEKDIELDPGSSQTVTFVLSKTEPGSYKVGVGSMSSTLVVKSTLVAKEIQLKYDDGSARDYLSLSKPNTGYLVDFIAPSNPFVINNVRIYGLIYGGHGFLVKDIEVQIWDKDKTVIYTTTIPGKSFPLLSFLLSDIQSKGAWVDVEVPDIKVEGNFSIHVYTDSTEGQGFRMGADDSEINSTSDITIRNEAGADTAAPNWPYSATRWNGDRTHVHWMVRVVGNAMVPQE
jgi:hypothetical protein